MMFNDKLNKLKSGVHSIEEEIVMVDGKWEGYLRHDNVVKGSISVHTEPKLEGIKITNYYTSYREDEEWKTYIRVLSNSPKVYISYESEGDQVEADDINNIQDAISNEIERSKGKEVELDEKIDNETNRSKGIESELIQGKADKSDTFTKEEVSSLIDDIPKIEKVSELENDKGYLTEGISCSQLRGF